MPNRLLLLLVPLFIATGLQGQTVTYPFAEDAVFDGDSFGNAEITVDSGRAYFTLADPTSSDGQFIYWLGTAPTTSNWQVQVDVHLPTSASLGISGTESVYANLVVYRTGDSLTYTGNQPDFNGAYASLARNAGISPNDFLVGSNYRPGVTVFGSNVSSSSTDVSLRVGFNNSTKGISSFYDANGATGGYAFTSLNASVDTDAAATSWLMTPGDTFSFAIILQATGPQVNYGDFYIENFKTTGLAAIPEPSTYAALAGLLALGLVAWRRRMGQPQASGSHTMSRAVLRLLLALGVSLSAHSLHGQFTFEGTDDFNDGVPALGSGLRWSGVFGSNTGTVAWTETNQRLEFTGSHETASPLFSQYGWNSGADVALFDNTSWTASIELSVPHVPTSGFVQGALIVSLVGGSGRSYGLYLYSGVGETKVTSVYTLSNAPTVIDTDFISDVTDVELRLQWDATARTMTSSYRFSPLDAYTTSATLDVVGTLGFDPTGGFYVNPSARATSGESVASGGLYFDNMSVTAIPEPSTYAAVAGLGALGLALRRKRLRLGARAVSVLACLAVLPLASPAQTVTIQAQGTLYTSYTYLGVGLSSIIPVGSAFTATWTYDASSLVSTTAAAIGPGSVQEATAYGFSNFTATFTANGYTFTAPIGSGGAGVTIFNDSTALGTLDGIKLIGRTSGVAAPTQNSFYLNSISLQLLTPTLSTFSDQSLNHVSEGATFVSQPAGANNMLLLSAQSPTNVSYLTELYGSISSYSYTVSAIPEPSTYAALAGLGALGLACWRRRQKTAGAA